MEQPNPNPQIEDDLVIEPVRRKRTVTFAEEEDPAQDDDSIKGVSSTEEDEESFHDPSLVGVVQRIGGNRPQGFGDMQPTRRNKLDRQRVEQLNAYYEQEAAKRSSQPVASPIFPSAGEAVRTSNKPAGVRRSSARPVQPQRPPARQIVEIAPGSQRPPESNWTIHSHHRLSLASDSDSNEDEHEARPSSHAGPSRPKRKELVNSSHPPLIGHIPPPYLSVAKPNARGRSEAVANQYHETAESYTIKPGLETGLGSHQGSMPDARRAHMMVKRLGLRPQQPESEIAGHQGGVITIKKLLSRRTIEQMADPPGGRRRRTSLDAHYDEIYLKHCNDTDSPDHIRGLIDTATNLDRNTFPYGKEASYAVIYLDDCRSALNILDSYFELQKSNWGEGDNGFIRWATGTEDEEDEDESSSRGLRALFPSIGSQSYRGRSQRNRIAQFGSSNASSTIHHSIERIPQSFSWEPFGFPQVLDFGEEADPGDPEYVGRFNEPRDVRRLMFTFEFLVPYECTGRRCVDSRTFLQCGTSTHIHTFVQRRSVLVQTSERPDSELAAFEREREIWSPSGDKLCIVADIPLLKSNYAPTYEAIISETSPPQANEPMNKSDETEKIRTQFYASISPSKYRFRPSFRLGPTSDTWYTVAVVYFMLKDVIESWTPLIQACIGHVEYRERSVLSSATSPSHTAALWQDRQHWIFLHSILDAHMANISRLRSYVIETFPGTSHVATEAFADLIARVEEVEKKIEKHLKERTDNLVDLVFNTINTHDAHVSAETGTSMWRLSWITFVFLPLTFLAGIFGMNVQSFANPDNVKIQWYFISAFIMLFVVIIVIWLMKERVGASLVQSTKEKLQRALKSVFSRRKKHHPLDDDIEANDTAPLFIDEFLLEPDDSQTSADASEKRKETEKNELESSENHENNDREHEQAPQSRERLAPTVDEEAGSSEKDSSQAPKEPKPLAPQITTYPDPTEMSELDDPIVSGSTVEYVRSKLKEDRSVEANQPGTGTNSYRRQSIDDVVSADDNEATGVKTSYQIELSDSMKKDPRDAPQEGHADPISVERIPYLNEDVETDHMSEYENEEI